MTISLMEPVANDRIQPWIPAGFVTVGYEVSVKHKSPALSGTKVTAKRKQLEADGRKLLIEVCAMQEDKVIGEGFPQGTIVKGTG